MRTLLIGVFLVLITACASDAPEVGTTPESAAQAFLSLIDQGDYQESWSEASSLLQSNVDANQWAEHAGGFRQPLGTVNQRAITDVEYVDSLEGMPAGEYAFVTFEGSSADDRRTYELVGLVLGDDSIWRVMGYQTD